MKISLRDKFRTTDFLDASQPPLERMGALYYSGQQADKHEIQEKLKQLLSLQASNGRTHHEILLCLHAATLLAQHGNFAGIEFILNILGNTQSREHFKLAEVALRNCSQFPLAVLLAQLIDLSKVSQLDKRIIGLMKQSDDDLFELNHQEKQKSYLDGLVSQLEFLEHFPHLPERKLSVGTIISRPIRKDFGFRYTGFVAIDNSYEAPLVVPYDMGDVLNRNDQRARQDVYQLISRPGCRAIVVHDVNSPYEARQLYILPFATQTHSETENLVSKLAISGVGLQVGIVAELSIGKRDAYRIITANGQSQLGYYMVNRKKIGNAFFIHVDNSQPLNTRFRVSEDTVSRVVQLFKANSSLDVAVYIRTYENQHWFASRNGHLVMMWGESAPAGCFVEEVVIDGEIRHFPFGLSSLTWSLADLISILSSYWAKNPQAKGVVLATFEYKGKKRARVIQADSGAILTPDIDQDWPGGTLAFCETGFDGKIYANILPNYRTSGGCNHCFGTGYRTCVTCGGEAWMTCPQCYGTREVTCPECGGTGKTTCGHCYGSGTKTLACKICSGTGKCPNCEGTGLYTIGDCSLCGGSGLYRGYGTCNKCSGSGKFRKPCRWCSGSGTCNKCEGSGDFDVDCRTCEGSGKWNCDRCRHTGRDFCDCGNGYVPCTTCNQARVSRCSCGGKDKGYFIAVE